MVVMFNPVTIIFVVVNAHTYHDNIFMSFAKMFGINIGIIITLEKICSTHKLNLWKNKRQ